MRWTNAVQRPAQPIPPVPAPPVPQGASQGTRNDLVVRGRVGIFRDDVYADATSVTYGGTTMHWADVEWFGYSVTQEYVQNMAFGVKMGGPRDDGSTFRFTLGRGSYRKARGVKPGPVIDIRFVHGESEAQDDTWSGLVSLLRAHLQPRLHAQILGAIRTGQQLNIAGEYTVDAHGFSSLRMKNAYRWSDINVVVERGRVRLRPIGRPISEGMQLDPAVPNVLLIPDLHAELAPRR
ncbi:hypothetical protein ABIA39_004713 [Nocardia sp. GAS34]